MHGHVLGRGACEVCPLLGPKHLCYRGIEYTQVNGPEYATEVNPSPTNQTTKPQTPQNPTDFKPP